MSAAAVPTSAHPTPDSALTSPWSPALLVIRRTVKAIESMLTFQAKTIVGVRNVLRGSGVLRHRELPNRGPVLREGVAAVAERVGWIENQSASLEEALEELSLALEERNVLEPLQRVTSFRKRATSFRKAGPESQAI